MVVLATMDSVDVNSDVERRYEETGMLSVNRVAR